jgi:hypothetical protein
MMAAHVMKPRPRPSLKRISLDAFDEVITHGMAKGAELRFASAATGIRRSHRISPLRQHRIPRSVRSGIERGL